MLPKAMKIRMPYIPLHTLKINSIYATGESVEHLDLTQENTKDYQLPKISGAKNGGIAPPFFCPCESDMVRNLRDLGSVTIARKETTQILKTIPPHS